MHIDKRITLIFFSIALLLVSGCVAKEGADIETPAVFVPEGGPEEALKLTVQCTTTPSIALSRYQPIVDYLEEETKLKIELVIAETYDDFSELQKQGDVDFVIQDSFSTYLITRHADLNHLASIVSPVGEMCDTGYVFVKADSDIEDLNDLKGRTILFGPKANAAKFLAPYITLKKSGIDPEEGLTYEFGGMCPNNAMSVYLGEYDASVVCGLYMAQEDKKFNFETDLRIIGETECLPYWIVSSSEKTDEGAADKVKQALLKLHIGNPKTGEVLNVSNWKGFAEYSGELDEIGDLVQQYSITY